MTLAANPRKAPGFVKVRWQPGYFSLGRMDRLIRDLDDRRFGVRRKATEDLESLGEHARQPLRRARAVKTTLEFRRRLELILRRKADLSPEGCRVLRAAALLEHLASPEAREVLEQLRADAPDTLLEEPVPAPAVGEASPAAADSRWRDLASPNALRASRAVLALVADPRVPGAFEARAACGPRLRPPRNGPADRRTRPSADR